MATTNANCPTWESVICTSDVLTYTDFASFPTTGEADKWYIDNATWDAYSWNWTQYVTKSWGTTSNIITNLDWSQVHDNWDGALTPIFDVNIYEEDGTLTGNRTVTMAGNDLNLVWGDVNIWTAWTNDSQLAVLWLSDGTTKQDCTTSFNVWIDKVTKKFVPIDNTSERYIDFYDHMFTIPNTPTWTVDWLDYYVIDKPMDAVLDIWCKNFFSWFYNASYVSSWTFRSNTNVWTDHWVIQSRLSINGSAVSVFPWGVWRIWQSNVIDRQYPYAISQNAAVDVPISQWDVFWLNLYVALPEWTVHNWWTIRVFTDLYGKYEITK